jgi:hypothetical protein
MTSRKRHLWKDGKHLIRRLRTIFRRLCIDLFLHIDNSVDSGTIPVYQVTNRYYLIIFLFIPDGPTIFA